MIRREQLMPMILTACSDLKKERVEKECKGMKVRFKKKSEIFDVGITAIGGIVSVGTMLYGVWHLGLRETWPELVLNLFYIACLVMMWMYFFNIRITSEQFNYWSSVCVGITILLRDILFAPPLMYYSLHLACSTLSILLILVVVAALILQKYLLRAGSYDIIKGKATRPMLIKLRGAKVPLLILAYIILFIIVVMPLAMIIIVGFLKAYGLPITLANMTLDNYKQVLFNNTMVADSIKNSIFLSFSAGIIWSLSSGKGL